MSSAFSHAVVAIGIGVGATSGRKSWRLILLGALSATLPDIDAIGYFYGIPYESQWGHRGFTHSFLFAGLWVLFLLLFFRKSAWKNKFWIFLYLFVCTATHSVFDAMVDAGKGVAFFWPWELKRYFFEFRPIIASPISVQRFFTAKGLAIIKNEMLWMWLPTFLIFLSLKFLRNILQKFKRGNSA